MIRSLATFDDTVTPIPSTDGDTEPPPGRDVAEALADAVAVQGLEPVEPVAEHDGYGWAFSVEAAGRPVWCMVQASDHWLLITHVPRSLWERLRGRHAEEAHDVAVTVLERALSASGRWRDVRWYTPEEFQKAGRQTTETP
jgi:hypothetical protein